MDAKDLEVVDGGLAGAWIRPGLGGEFGAVTLEVPKGFEAYARIFHPATDTEGNRYRWAEVAEIFGATAHREMQWHAILGLADPDELGVSRWSGCDPPIGTMDLDTLDALSEVLNVQTADPSQCYFGLCTIEVWLDSFSADELKPLLELLSGRDYVVLAGPLSAVDQIARTSSDLGPSSANFVFRSGEGPLPEREELDWKWREAPSLIWPTDHSWLVASEVDFDSTLVGGSADLIKAIVDAPDLEAWQVEPTDSLAADADKINKAGQR